MVLQVGEASIAAAQSPPFFRSCFALYEICPQPNEWITGLAEQLPLFADQSPAPEGLRYAIGFVSPAIEQNLMARIAELPLQPFQFGQYEGKRRVASFGYRYDYTLRRLRDADPIPEGWRR